MVFLDVGQGDAVFIETPSHRQILVDAGVGAGILAELGRVMYPWDRTIDMVIATHPDNDHIGGIPDVLDHYRVARMIDNGFGPEGKHITEIYHEKIGYESDVEHQISQVPQRLDLGDGVILTFLHTIIDDIADSNERSLLMRLEYGEASFLLTGDAGTSIENYLIEEQYEYLDVDVLKLGHHGSNTSTSDVFLQATTPNIAVISAGRNNSYGHPHEAVLRRLDKYDIESVCTCEEGRITFQTDGVELVMK